MAEDRERGREIHRRENQRMRYGDRWIMNVGEEKDMKNVPEKNEMVNTSTVKDVVKATVKAQIMNIDFIILA